MELRCVAYVFHILAFGTLALADLTPNCSAYYNTIDNEGDLFAIEQDCTTIAGVLGVNTAFKGLLDLHGVESIDQLLIPYDFDDPCNLTQISLPDLLNATVIDIVNIPLVTNISFPKLQSVGYINPYGDQDGQAGINNQGGYLLNLSFPVLEAVWGDLLLSGNIGSVSLPSIKNITFFSANSTSDLDCISLLNTLKSIPSGNFTARCTSTRNHATLYQGDLEFGPGYCPFENSTCWQNSTTTGTSQSTPTGTSAPTATESGKKGGSGAVSLSTERSGIMVIGSSVVLAALLMAIL